MQGRTPNLSPFGLAILPAYLGVTLLIGWASRRKDQTANAFLNASRSLPLPIVAASFLAANCGALEIVGLSAYAAQHGVQALHFYWIGAIPAMVFLGIYMLPVYVRSGVRSIPEYLAVRFGPGVRLLNAWILAGSMLMLAGVSLYAMSQVLEVVLGTSFFTGALLSAAVVVAYVFVGGVRATIYTEVFQLAIMIGGLLPICLRTWHRASFSSNGGVHFRHLWSHTPSFAPHASTDIFGTVVGLGFVLSFGYWCTDFVLMQRALAARTLAQAQEVPLWAGFGKLLFSLMVVPPGIAAATLFRDMGRGGSFDQALPRMMSVVYGPTLLGLGLTAITASLMSGFAANISGFAAIWTEDIYRSALVTDGDETHYLRVGRLATLAAILISLVTSFASFLFANLMDYVQLIFSLTTAPFWAIFVLGATTKRVTAKGAFWGLSAGVACGVLHEVMVLLRADIYGSVMSASFHAAVYSFCAALAGGWFFSGQKQNERSPSVSLVKFGVIATTPTRVWMLSALLLLACLALNLLWW